MPLYYTISNPVALCKFQVTKQRVNIKLAIFHKVSTGSIWTFFKYIRPIRRIEIYLLIYLLVRLNADETYVEAGEWEFLWLPPDHLCNAQLLPNSWLPAIGLNSLLFIFVFVNLFRSPGIDSQPGGPVP
jgi:hypothetical protein